MQLLFRLMAAMALLLTLVACPDNSSTTCQSKDDCTAGQICCKQKSTDKEGTCKADADCKVAPTCEGTPCKEDSDCSGGETCDKANQCCKKKATVTCTKHLDCPKGNDCVPSGDQKTCVPCAQECTAVTDCSGGGQVCENGCCRLPSCKTDTDCKNRKGKPFCKKETGECVPCLKSADCQQTDEQSICRNDRCVKVECTQDRHCTNPPKISCNQQNNKCTEPPVCKDDRDCTDPQLNRCDPNADGGRGACKKGHCTVCNNDDECGSSKDFCVGVDKGLKDGRRCLRACNDTKDCPTGFLCSSAVISGFKICFPTNGYCEDPCAKVTCQDNETCVEGVCKPKPDVCVDCSKDGPKACLPGADCLTYPSGKFCGKACKTTADCPTDPKRDFTCLNGQCLAQKGCQ